MTDMKLAGENGDELPFFLSVCLRLGIERFDRSQNENKRRQNRYDCLFCVFTLPWKWFLTVMIKIKTSRQKWFCLFLFLSLFLVGWTQQRYRYYTRKWEKDHLTRLDTFLFFFFCFSGTVKEKEIQNKTTINRAIIKPIKTVWEHEKMILTNF